MAWTRSPEGVSGQTHEGTNGVHLKAGTCPEGCWQIYESDWAQGGVQRRQSRVNAILVAEGMVGKLILTMRSTEPGDYVIKWVG